MVKLDVFTPSWGDGTRYFIFHTKKYQLTLVTAPWLWLPRITMSVKRKDS